MSPFAGSRWASATRPASRGAARWQRLAHIAEQEQLGRRNAIGMGCDGPLADIDLAVWEQLAKVIVGPAVAEPQLEHLTIQIADQIRREIEASALRLEATDEAVEPAHDGSGGNTRRFHATV